MKIHEDGSNGIVVILLEEEYPRLIEFKLIAGKHLDQDILAELKKIAQKKFLVAEKNKDRLYFSGPITLFFNLLI